jgi:predicted nucleic acid-binding protein
MIFCDTSTVAKLYVPEKESVAVRRLLEGATEVCVSDLLRVELMAVFHRRLRERTWTAAEFRIAVRQFANDDLGGFWTWLPLDRAITAAAAQTFATLPDSVFLRSADCIHLITALHHNFAEIYTYDSHQTKAATTMGLKALTV